jgi:Ca2+-transporting ATPase
VQVPADLRIVDSAQLTIVEAVLTGESEPVLKQSASIRCKSRPSLGDRKNQAYMSSLVAKGRGIGVVTNTGVTTEVGKISSMVFGASITRTPLQIKLAWLGKVLVCVAVVSCAVIITIGLVQVSRACQTEPQSTASMF